MESTPLNKLYTSTPTEYNTSDKNAVITPLKQMESNVRQKAELTFVIPDTLSQTSSYLTNLYSGNKGIKLKNYSINLEESHKKLSDGTYTPMYKNFIQGSDNNERLAQNQSSTEQVFNGLTKAGNNMLTTIFGNTAGFVYGIANGVKEGNMNAVFDNSFSKTLDDWNTKLNYQLPNYVTEDNKNKGFFGSLTDDTANFIFNDVAQGFSFTIGTAVSEAIWAYATGGASLATSAARVGARAASLGRLVRGTEELGALGRWSKAALGAEQVGLGVSKYKSFLNTAIVNEFKAGKLSKDAAIALGKAGDVLTTARFIGTTSSNEAGIEAFHFKKEARENFENNFERQYGREATAEERAEFESDLASAANGVYYTNMAILSVSNMAMFGGLFNIKTPFSALEKQMNKSLFGIGTREVEKGVFKGIEATRKQKIFTGTYQILKPTFTEGVFEEGLQGVTTKVANKWTDSTYNPKYHDQTLSLASAAYESMAEQYGTKEGWKEIGIGGLIGLFGVFGKGGTIAKTKEARKYQEDYVAEGLTAFGEKSLFAQDAFVNSILRDAKIQGSIAREQDAIKRGDAVGAHLAQSDKIIAEAQYREPMGGNLDDLKVHAEIAMNSATEEMWNNAGIKKEDRENFIQATLTGYNQVIDSYKEASNFANALVGNGAIRGTTYQTQVIKDALTHAIVSGEVSHLAMNESLRDISKYIGEENAKAVEIVGSLWQLSKAKQNQVKTLTKEHEDITEKEAEVEKKLAELQTKPKSPTEADTTTGTQLQKLAALRVTLQERKTQIEQEQDTIASEISQLNQRRAIADETSDTDLNTSTISGQDLRDIDKKMSNIDAIVEGYSGTNKIDHNNLMTAMKQYKSARDTFYTYQATVDTITRGKFEIKNKSGFLFKLFDSNYKMDDFTTDFLADISERHLNGYMELGAEEELKNIKSELVTLEVLTEKTEEQEKRIQEINKRIVALEKEPSLQERKEALEKELESIQDDTNPRIAEIDLELNEIEKELTPNDTPNISKEAITEAPKTEVEILKDRIAEIVKNLRTGYISKDIDEMVKDRPDQKDMNRYDELIRSVSIKTYLQVQKTGTDNAKRDFYNKNKDVIDEYEALYNKLSNWRIYDSLVDEQQSIVDLLDLIQQMEQEIGEKETLEVGQEAFSFLGEDSTPAVFVANLGNNTNFTPTARLINKDVVLTHLKIATIISRIPNAEVIVKQPNKKKLENPSKEVLDSLRNAEIIIKEGVNEYYFKLTLDGRLAINAEVFKSLSQLLNMYTSVEVTKKYVNWSWHHLAEQRGGELVPMKSDFYNKELEGSDTFDREEGDTIELYVDVNDVHSKRIAEGKNLDELTSQVRIYLRKDGKNYNDLKALNTGDVDPNFLALREAAANQFLTGKSGVIGTTKITYVPLGLPIMTLGSDNTIQPIEITQDGLREVVTTGYILNGELVLANKGISEKVRKSFVSKLSAKEKDKKVPIIVFKRGKHLIAFPITMNKTANSKKEEFDTIVEGVGTEAQKIKAINNLLLESGLMPKTYGLISWDEVKLKAIGTVLDSLEDSVSAESLADIKYDKNSLTVDAKIALDLTDLPRVMQSQKLNYDLNNIDYTVKEAEPVNKGDVYDAKPITKEVERAKNIVITREEATEALNTGKAGEKTLEDVAAQIDAGLPLSENAQIIIKVASEKVAQKRKGRTPVEKFEPKDHSTKTYKGVQYLYVNGAWKIVGKDGELDVDMKLSKILTKDSKDKLAKGIVEDTSERPNYKTASKRATKDKTEKEEIFEMPKSVVIEVIPTDDKANKTEENRVRKAVQDLAQRLFNISFSGNINELTEEEQVTYIQYNGDVKPILEKLRAIKRAEEANKKNPQESALRRSKRTVIDATEAIEIYTNFFKDYPKDAIKNLIVEVRASVQAEQKGTDSTKLRMIDYPIVSPTKEDIDNNVPPVGAIHYTPRKTTYGVNTIDVYRFDGSRWVTFGLKGAYEVKDMSKEYFTQIEVERKENEMSPKPGEIC